MAQKVIFATGNAGKIREAGEILAELGMEVVSMKEAKVVAEPEENGKTYAENALIKARAVAALTEGVIVLADDSGLEIDYLNNEPGIYSARYLGEDTSYKVKNNNLIERLEGVEDAKRTARFMCAIAAVLPDGRELTTLGVVEGRIGYEEKGEGGFGYDPIFYLPEFGKTTAELSEEEKVLVNRARKIQKFSSHPFFVAEQFTGLSGKYVPLSETIRSFKEILEGKHDDIPESYFLNAGSIEDVLERVK